MIVISVPALMAINGVLQSDVIGRSDLSDWSADPLSISIGCMASITGFGAVSLNVIGYQYGEATKVVWSEYLILVFAFLYQIFVFDVIPNQFEIVGVILIITACMLSLAEELYVEYRKRQRDPPPFLASVEVGYGSERELAVM